MLLLPPSGEKFPVKVMIVIYHFTSRNAFVRKEDDDADCDCFEASRIISTVFDDAFVTLFFANTAREVQVI